MTNEMKLQLINSYEEQGTPLTDADSRKMLLEGLEMTLNCMDIMSDDYFIETSKEETVNQVNELVDFIKSFE